MRALARGLDAFTGTTVLVTALLAAFLIATLHATPSAPQGQSSTIQLRTVNPADATVGIGDALTVSGTG
jgi:hypothetical protein